MIKNILSGIGSVLVLCPTSGYSHYKGNGIDFERSDFEALQADVEAIGVDFYKAADHGREYAAEKKATNECR
ncbi:MULTISPECIES: hypothetical protein [Pseudomonas]|uniref:hypothetical protein n=1 Tax=Pseudomonas TaxID=286 RepID=UPI000369A6F7|nr:MULTISPECIES: hypothetical protein [Pseudomonas]WNF56044.1 hypothetical protein RHP74_01810 [Pseudomonas sp. SG20052]